MKFLLHFLLAVGSTLCAASAADLSRPNIIVILADDLGYGDLGCYNPASKIPTPNLNRLAAQGMRFTDAHTPSAVCTPTRYGLLTGRYAWRTWLKSGVLDGFDPPLIDAGRPTIASFLKTQGYATACIGKWHLGMTWTDKAGKLVPYRGTSAGGFRAGADVDFSREIRDGPMERGFDLFFGISASLDMSPYGYIEGNRVAPAPTRTTPETKDLFMNQVAGVASDGFVLSEVLPTLMQRAVAYVESRAAHPEPFFLYLPLNSPHLPVVPSKRWQGKSGAGLYGDFVMETDAEVGRLLAALERANLAENTLVVFTSDNGGLWHQWDAKETVDVAGYKPTPRGRYTAERGHHSNAALRGTKADIYEGGHRVPFIIRWPARVKPGSSSAALIELNDLFATCAEITGATLPQAAAEDSFSFRPALTGEPSHAAARTFAVHHSLAGVFALREGPWKFVPSRGSGGFSAPKAVAATAGEPTGQLYHLGQDPAETSNVWSEHPELVARFQAQLNAVRQKPRTRP